MSSDILLSLCIPTNGVIEWVIPVIESIYAEMSPVGQFEVVVTDNGNNTAFEVMMNSYVARYGNLVYKKTQAVQFQNQIEAFKLARGTLIKFINHRMRLLPGALNYFIKYARENKEEKPITYFSNGVLQSESLIIETSTFDQYVRSLSIYSSWSAGTAMWKSDYDRMNLDINYNRYFPHIDMVFFDKNGNNYKIVNKVLLEEVPTDDTKKGKYDLFDAFSYEYVRVLEGIYKEGFITQDTFEYLKKKNKRFVAELYYKYVFRKKPCSYNLDGFYQAIDHYYSKFDIYCYIPRFIAEGLYKKILRSVKNKYLAK